MLIREINEFRSMHILGMISDTLEMGKSTRSKSGSWSHTSILKLEISPLFKDRPIQNIGIISNKNSLI